MGAAHTEHPSFLLRTHDYYLQLQGLQGLWLPQAPTLMCTSADRQTDRQLKIKYIGIGSGGGGAGL